ncbi:hypothetical protein FH972_011169 [Carpinus fangiana]|uniref:EF-hand domain-containing protein n=1 Tax=Carpinus fangiana TaxID=176857 RepID=A0A660KWL3_9ROSI|nr:hypothetical protein FH972_011169 [Carpinus fangiana]
MPNQNAKTVKKPTAMASQSTEYERQRLSRIAENRSRMVALGLPKIASKLWGSAQKVSEKMNKKKGKAKVDDEDEDYRLDKVEEGLSSSTGDEETDDDDDYLDETSSGSRRKKVKNIVSKPKKKVPAQKCSSESDDIDDALKQALALSLQGSAGVSGVVHCEPSKCSETDVVNATPNENKGNTRVQEDTGRRKRKKPFASRLQMTEDELVVNFFQFDGEWKGSITMRDIERVAMAHDFMWTEKELADMIQCFDSDGDGKVSSFCF